MCGDDDDFDRVDEELFNRFTRMAARHGVTMEPALGHTLGQLNDSAARQNYMENLFRAGLNRSVNDASSMPQGERMDLLAGQAIVFARLAGFIAGQFPPETDLFHTVISAIMEGHRETAGTHHSHDHDHDHDHDHHH